MEEAPFRPAAGVVLLRPGAAAEAQLRIREEAAEVHPGQPVEEPYQEPLHKVQVRRLFFCVQVRVREAPAVLPLAEALHRQLVVQEQARSQRTSVRSGGR